MGKNRKYFSPENLCFSEIYGDGSYAFEGEFMADPFGDPDAPVSTPILTNLHTGETFFPRKTHLPLTLLPRLRQWICNPADREYVTWPVDLVSLSDGQAEYCNLAVPHGYQAAPLDLSDARHALLFPCTGWPNLTSASRRIAQFPALTWRDPAVRQMAADILTAIEGVNRSGYLYCDIHPSRIFFMDNAQVLFDYSNLIYPLEETISPDAHRTCAPAEGEYPLEFAEPAYVNRRETNRPELHMDLRYQNYSLAAFLFYLFFDRYPYDGRLIEGESDIDLVSHYAKFQRYHDLPIFIFDPNDTQNALGTFAHEQELVTLWEDLPNTMKEPFIQTLCKDTAMRRNGDKEVPTAGMWLQYLAQTQWPQ